MCGKVIHGELCKKIEIWPDEQVVSALLRIHPGEWDSQSSIGFWDTNESSNLDQMTRPSDCKKKKEKKR